MEELDPISAQIREVYARFGLAVYQSQCVERELAILLATVYGPGPKRITRSEYDSLLHSLFKKTLGSLISQLRKSANLSSDLEDALDQALQYRNWLAHHYFWERAGQFASERGRQQMIDELQDIVEFLNSFDAELTVISNEWGKQHGVTDADYQRALEKVLSDAEDGV